ncbi:MAG TPA: hypothetical protein VEZ55_10250 [Chitinophagaceae bacterium]|jgi:hypothetical protein|nr:hypothetical protein [Chitinophagaceae bacterium]
MITLAQFNELTLQQQTAVLYSKGGYLCSRQEPSFIIDLYELDGFYVEAYCHQKSQHVIALKAFGSADATKAYFEQNEGSLMHKV